MIVSGIPFVFVFALIMAIAFIRRRVVPICRLLVRGPVRLAIGNIACRLHDEIWLLPKTRAARWRCRMFARSPLVTVVSVRAVIRIDVPYILLILGRRIAIIVWCSQNLVRRGIAGGLTDPTAPIVRSVRCRRSTISFVHRHALTDEPCQFGKRIVSLSARRLLRAAPTGRIAIGTLIVFSHQIRLVQPCTGETKPRDLQRNIRPAFAAGNTERQHQ